MWTCEVWKGNKEAAVKTDEGEGPPLIARAMWMGTGPRLGKPSWFSTIFLLHWCQLVGLSVSKLVSFKSWKSTLFPLCIISTRKSFEGASKHSSQLKGSNQRINLIQCSAKARREYNILQVRPTRQTRLTRCWNDFPADWNVPGGRFWSVWMNVYKNTNTNTNTNT